MSRKPKIHLRHANQRHMPVCNRPLVSSPASGIQLTSDLTEVTCKSCLRSTGNKTTEQGGRIELVDVVVRSTGPMFINFIKAVRELPKTFELGTHHWAPVLRENGYFDEHGKRRYFGLKESKDFADTVRNGAAPLAIATRVGREIADNIRQVLIDTGAVVTVEDKDGNTPERGTITGRGRALEILRQIIEALPTNKDWLDPVLEAEARYLIGGVR